MLIEWHFIMSGEKPYADRNRLCERAWKGAERRALDQARRVSWKRLAEAADQYTEWHVFSLWLRAVVDAAHTLPEIVKSEIKNRVPDLWTAWQPSKCIGAIEQATSPGARLWQEVWQWAEANVFLSAKTENWLEAVRYFSSVSIRSMKAWAHWERTDDIWQRAAPATFPSYEDWQADVESVNKLANPETVCQQVLDGMGRVTPQEFRNLEAAFFELTAFSLWMELAIDKSPNLGLVEQEIFARHKGFKSSDGFSDPQANVHALSEWVMNHQPIDVREQSMRAALSYQVRNHPRYHALRRYAQHCRQAR
ncbi:MAG: hypothetical protein ACRD22_15165, partial [Terriglobia bacterium]